MAISGDILFSDTPRIQDLSAPARFPAGARDLWILCQIFPGPDPSVMDKSVWKIPGFEAWSVVNPLLPAVCSAQPNMGSVYERGPTRSVDRFPMPTSTSNGILPTWPHFGLYLLVPPFLRASSPDISLFEHGYAGYVQNRGSPQKITLEH